MIRAVINGKWRWLCSQHPMENSAFFSYKAPHSWAGSYWDSEERVTKKFRGELERAEVGKPCDEEMDEINKHMMVILHLYEMIERHSLVGVCEYLKDKNFAGVMKELCDNKDYEKRVPHWRSGYYDREPPTYEINKEKKGKFAMALLALADLMEEELGPGHDHVRRHALLSVGME